MKLFHLLVFLILCFVGSTQKTESCKTILKQLPKDDLTLKFIDPELLCKILKVKPTKKSPKIVKSKLRTKKPHKSGKL